VDAALRLNNYNKSRGKGTIPEPKEGQSYKDWYNSLSADQKNDIRLKVEDDILKRSKEIVLPTIREGVKGAITDPNTSVEWKQLAEETFWGGAYAGLVKSLPAMVAPGGWAGRTAAFFGQSNDAVNEEMSKNPAFADVPESEKLLVSIPIGIANAVLEEVGLSNVIKNKGFVNSLVLKGLQKAGLNATETTLSKIIKNDVESMIARGGLTLVGAGLAEAETGAGQQIAEYAVKDIYNLAKKKEMFDTPDTLKEYVYDVVRSGAQEAVGGFVMGTPSAAAAAYRKRGFEGMSDEQFKTFEAIANDDKMQSSFIANLKAKTAAGDMTMAEAKEELNDYRNSVGLYRSVPTDLDTESKKKAMNLVREKQVIEDSIKDKDEALVKKQKDRIAEINVQLNTLSENAVQKQTTSEVPVQSETGVSEEVERGEPTAEPQVTTEEDKEEVVTPTAEVTTPTQEEENRKKFLESWLAVREEEEKKGNDFFMEGFPTEENPNRKPTRITFEEAQAELDALNAKAATTTTEAVTTPVTEAVTETVTEAPMAEVNIAPETEIPTEIDEESLVEYNPKTEDIQDEDMAALSSVIKSKKIKPQAEPQVTDFGDIVTFEYRNLDEDDTWTRLTFKRNKKGTLSARGVKVERNTGSIRGSQFYQNYITDQKGKIAPTPAVEATPVAKPAPVVEAPAVELTPEENKQLKVQSGKIEDALGISSEEADVLLLIHSSNLLTPDEKAILYRQYKRGVMSIYDIKKYTAIDLEEINSGVIDKWAEVLLNIQREKGSKLTADDIDFEEINETPTEEAPKKMTREEIRAKEEEIAEENRKSKEILKEMDERTPVGMEEILAERITKMFNVGIFK